MLQRLAANASLFFHNIGEQIQAAEDNTLKERLILWNSTRLLMKSTGLNDNIFVNELSFVPLFGLTNGLWTYSQGAFESCTVDSQKQAFADGILYPDSIFTATLVNEYNIRAAKDDPYFKSLKHRYLDDMHRCLFTSVDCQTVNQLFDLQCNDIRNLTILSTAICNLIKSVTDWICRGSPSEDGVINIMPSGSVQLVFNDFSDVAGDIMHQTYNHWVEESSAVEETPVGLCISADGARARVTSATMGYLVRRVLYFLSKYKTKDVFKKCPISDKVLMDYVSEPITTRELMEELLYFSLQGDLNPFVFSTAKVRKAMAKAIIEECELVEKSQQSYTEVKLGTMPESAKNAKWVVKGWSATSAFRYILRRGDDQCVVYEINGAVDNALDPDKKAAIVRYDRGSLRLSWIKGAKQSNAI